MQTSLSCHSGGALLSIILALISSLGGNRYPSLCKELYTSSKYFNSYRPVEATAQDCTNSKTFCLTASSSCAPPYALSSDTRLSRYSREAISETKCDPPFFTHVSVNFNVANWTFGFLFASLFFSDLIASLGCTVFDRIRSEISRLVAISSKLDEVAFSICSSRAEDPELNHDAILKGRWTAINKGFGGSPEYSC